jgi:hypothetical protein
VALFLTLSFPVIAYSIDSYSNIPQSEEDGLKFLVEKGSLEGETVFGTNMVQLALYAPPSFYKTRFESFNRKGLWDLSEIKADMFAFRNTGYYYAAMRIDRSFENNRFNEYLAEIENAGYHRIYSSPTFNVYSVDGMSR